LDPGEKSATGKDPQEKALLVGRLGAMGGNSETTFGESRRFTADAEKGGSSTSEKFGTETTQEKGKHPRAVRGASKLREVLQTTWRYEHREKRK